MAVSLDSHAFHVEIATQVGVEKAVILFNIIHWLNKNVLNEHSIHDGVAWTYNSSRAFSLQFPYIPASTLRGYLRELEDDGWLVSRNDLNRSKFDKTKWYSWGLRLDGYITGKGLVEVNQSIDENRQSSDVVHQTIPDITTNITSNINHVYVARANDNKISSILAANKHIRKLQDGTRIPPTPLLPGGEELAIDENPYGFTVPVKKT